MRPAKTTPAAAQELALHVPNNRSLQLLMGGAGPARPHLQIPGARLTPCLPPLRHSQTGSPHATRRRRETTGRSSTTTTRRRGCRPRAATPSAKLRAGKRRRRRRSAATASPYSSSPSPHRTPSAAAMRSSARATEPTPLPRSQERRKIGTLEEAAKAKEAGVDGIIVQGREAGGHVIGQEGLLPLLPRVVNLVSDSTTLVIAAGGIVDGRGYAAVLALGADGVCLGTRFTATEESFAHALYKKKLIEMNCTDYTNVFGRARWPDAPQRVLKTPFYIEWKNLPDHETEETQPIIGQSIIHGVHKDVRRFAGTVPNATTTGDINSMAMYAGQGVGLITEIIPAGEVVKRLVAEAQHVIGEKLCDFSTSSE